MVTPSSVWRGRWSEAQKEHKRRVDEVLSSIRAGAVEQVPHPKQSRRVGLLAQKMGMMEVYDEWGHKFAVTVLQVDRCQVVAVKKELSPSGRVGVQVGSGIAKPKRVAKPQRGHFDRAGVDYKKRTAEFAVTPDAVLPLGLELGVEHFVPGQHVDVCGLSVGRGFQGVMKRHGFKGQPATHGTSLTHRSLGSVGALGQGKIFKGKKMPGRMGGKRRTVQSLQLFRTDADRGLLYVRGSVPGKSGSWIRVTDAVRKAPTPDLPFPTRVTPRSEDEPAVLTAPKAERSPFPHGV